MALLGFVCKCACGQMESILVIEIINSHVVSKCSPHLSLPSQLISVGLARVLEPRRKCGAV